MLVPENYPGPARLSKAWLLPLAFLVGLVYLLMLPPWQQNDEPSQFEYVWLAANQDHWPRPGDVDAQMRREVLASMIDHGFYKSRPEQQPDLAQLEDPVTIGVSQLNDMPLYYFLASLPLRLFRDADVTQQLYMARFVSLLLFMAVVYCAIQISNLLFGNHLLGWMVAIFVALLPQLAYRMTAVNDDAAAVAAMTFFVWMSVRGIKLGLDLRTFVGLLFSMLMCFFAKPTAWLAMPFGFVALIMSLFKERQYLVWAGFGGLAIVVVLLAVEWQTSLPAMFYQYNGLPVRTQPTHVIDGEYAFATSRNYNGFHQVLDKEKLTTYSTQNNRMFTIGVWAWSNEPVHAYFLQLQFSGKDVLEVGGVDFTEEPHFFIAHTQIPEEYRAPVLRVVTGPTPPGIEIYWDCFVLVPGLQSEITLPKTSKNCSQVEWGGYRGENFVRNPSGEQGWPSFRSQVADFLPGFYRFQITDLWAVFDPPTSSVYYQDAVAYLFRTFWGRFNWGTLGLEGQKPYRLFAILSVLALLGNGIAWWRYRRVTNWNLVLFLLIMMVACLIYTLSRFAGDWANYYFWLPQARYFFPAIFPAAFFICTGWYALLTLPLKLKQFQTRFVTIFTGLFLLYNGWAWYTIWSYWYGG